MTAKEMLSAVIQRAVLTEREKESFVDMWDRIHRFGRCSDKQKAWIEKVYYQQKLDRSEGVPVRRRVVIPTWQKNEPKEEITRIQPTATLAVEAAPMVQTTSRQVLLPKRASAKSGTFMAAPAPPAKTKRVGYINYPGLRQEMRITSLQMFEEACPRIPRGSRQYQKIVEFFDRGGIVLKVKPLEESKVA